MNNQGVSGLVAKEIKVGIMIKLVIDIVTKKFGRKKIIEVDYMYHLKVMTM